MRSLTLCHGAVRDRAAGFTLVELITVIVILGILALGTVTFISDSSRGLQSTMARSDLAANARFIVERLTRELHNALPGSVRVSGACLEYIPLAGASRYLTLPVASAASTFRSVPVDPLPLPADVRVAVYPGSDAYDLTSPGTVSPPVAVSPPDADNEVTVTFDSAHRFASESPTRRYFLVTDPVSYCVAGEALYRYTGYGFSAAQPGPGSLPATLPGRSLVSERITSSVPFTLSGATLTRNAVVALNLTLARDDDRVELSHLVGVRNVP